MQESAYASASDHHGYSSEVVFTDSSLQIGCLNRLTTFFLGRHTAQFNRKLICYSGRSPLFQNERGAGELVEWI